MIRAMQMRMRITRKLVHTMEREALLDLVE